MTSRKANNNSHLNAPLARLRGRWLLLTGHPTTLRHFVQRIRHCAASCLAPGQLLRVLVSLFELRFVELRHASCIGEVF